MSAITMKSTGAGGCFKILIGAILIMLMVDLLLLVSAEKAAAHPCIDSERRALLHFKAALDDDDGMLSSWGSDEDAHNPNCCQWKGVTCNHLTGHVQRLDLHGDIKYDEIDGQEVGHRTYLSGEIHTSLIELQQLQYLNLSGNEFGDSHIPEFFASMSNLRSLDLSHCYFVGKIPSRFGTLSHLKYLNLGSNSLEGSIPYQLGNLSKLQYLDLSYNYLNGTIPSQLGNLSSLHKLYLGQSYYDEGAPKIDIGSRWLLTLTSLTHLDLSGVLNLNTSHSWLQMIGKLPKLKELVLADCSLSDHFILSLWPSKINFSTSLSVLDLSWNTFTSPSVFQWVSNVSFNLVELDLSGNLLEGSVSRDFGSAMIGKLPKLRELSLSKCNLSDYFLLLMTPSTFNFSTSLSVFDLSGNSFTSFKIFQWVSNISPNLVKLDLSGNLLERSMSNSFGSAMISHDLSNVLHHNNSQSWPEMIGKLPKLRKLRLHDCNLSDYFLFSMTPSRFNFSTSLSVFDLSFNSFTSFKIFECVSNISPKLIELDLSGNLLEGNESSRFGTMMNSLEQLYLSGNRLKGRDLKSFMNICTLRSLYVGGNNLTEDLPSILQNLSGGCVKYSLQNLDLSQNQIIGTLSELPIFPSLKTLDLSYNQLSGKIPEGTRLPPKLESLSIRSNSLEGGIPKLFGNTCTLGLLDLFNNSLNKELSIIVQEFSGCARHSLKELYLGMNQISGTLPDLSMFYALRKLDLSKNRLNGKIPKESRLPSQLEYLSIMSNSLEGGIPKSFGNTCTLRLLDFSNNSLSEELWVIIHNLSGCARYSIQNVYLEKNQIQGTLCDFSMFPSLKHLYLFENKLNGKILEYIRFPSKLEGLDISSNHLEGVITESHFANMSRLRELDLSHNPVALVFSQNWIPPFQLECIQLRSCRLAPHFPKWLQTQNKVETLDISNAAISDIVPEWFWAKILPEFASINISYNNLHGKIPNLPLRNSYYFLTLKSNQFEGSIPPFLRGAMYLDLSNNNFLDFHSFVCKNGTAETLGYLDLSNNQLSRQIPDCWSYFKSLAYLDLSNNRLSGKIPASMGSLLELQVLLLRNNSLSEEIPTSMKSCTKLSMLDVRENELSGHIPCWIGSELHELRFLSLQKNRFFGSLPLQLCHLKGVQLIDLSLNNLSGQIPKCIKNFTSMTQMNFSREFSGHVYEVNISSGGSYPGSYYLNEFLMWKGVEQVFEDSALSLLKSIDLSSNQLSGEIPTEIEILLGLISLNLSRNNLIGKIPTKIGRLTSLEFLDLSRNQLNGSIPSSLIHIDRLTVLDVSHNHLSGEIPIGTQLQSFNATSYEDNPDLCGKPLEKLCIVEEPPQEPTIKFDEDEHLAFTHAFYMSMAFGFSVGFWGIFGSILVKHSWRHAYFGFLNNLTSNIYVMIAVKVAKYKRWIKG